MKISDLKPFQGSVKKRKKIARGTGSGHGRTSTRGHKGQKSRSGGGTRVGFEGGQMPLYRRIPKLGGFKNIFKKKPAIINLSDLNGFEKGTAVNLTKLLEAGLIGKNEVTLKVLGDGELQKPLTIEAHSFSKAALEKIKKAGGIAQIISKSKG